VWAPLAVLPLATKFEPGAGLAIRELARSDRKVLQSRDAIVRHDSCATKPVPAI
jgi:hypothetical protein